MKSIAKKIRPLFLITIFGMGWWGYKVYHRNREIRDFFKDPEDLVWAKDYLDKKINFCDAPWKETIPRKVEGQDQYVSPSGRFRVKTYTNKDFEETLELINAKTDKILLLFSFDYSTKPAGISHFDTKWAKDEKFLIFRRPIAMDDDWATSDIYISNTATGEVIYFADSKFFECVTRNW